MSEPEPGPGLGKAHWPGTVHFTTRDSDLKLTLGAPVSQCTASAATVTQHGASLRPGPEPWP
jgi:hypothetical protein